jgi:4-alpha-glucanotransferase
LLPPGYPLEAADGLELTGEVHNAITGFLAKTPSMLMTLNQEDLTKETDQQNLPGTTWQYPNWRRKMRYSLEQLQTTPEAHDFAAMLRYCWPPSLAAQRSQRAGIGGAFQRPNAA